MKEEITLLNNLLKKKDLTYNEFNQLIGNYFVKDYEELDDSYYLITVMRPYSYNGETYTDYIRLM